MHPCRQCQGASSFVERRIERLQKDGGCEKASGLEPVFLEMLKKGRECCIHRR